MPMNLDSVGAVSQPSRSSWTSKDALLYAVGVGAGQTDPTGFELEFTTENSTDVEQRVLPTMPVVIGSGGRGLPSWGEFDFRMLLHGEQGVTVHGPIPADGEVDTVARIVGIYDKGKAAVIRLENKATYVGSGKLAFDTRFAAFIRGEGGFGESRGEEIADPPKMPDRKPDHEVTYATRADQALLYRLSGDRNPLHSDPTIAKFAGFDRPILHGLCSYGFTGRALLHELCGSDVARFKSMDSRFSKPVMPGDTLTVRMWDDGKGRALYQTVTQEGTVVIDGGVFTFE